MLDLLPLAPAIPLLSAAILLIFGGGMPRRAVAWLGAGSVGLSTAVALLIGYTYITAPPAGNAFRQTLWTWIPAGAFRAEVAFYLDALSLVMMLVVTFVSFLIHVYSTEYMAESEGYSRFFGYMNLFVASMVILVLADNLLLLFLGWEGVGLCSYLLIGFWYPDPANGRAAQKAFIVTRVGDTAFLIGLFLLLNHFESLAIQGILARVTTEWPAGSPLAVATAALLLGGAVGKSAQLPLQTWLPDAMAGPTPTSALIHAATMVTAGVYLIARTHAIFTLAPAVLEAVAVVGALTLLLAGFSALTQVEIKRVLAYSTVSQIGYMFLALGAGAWAAAIFHLMTHAFFKALLFLAAGVVIEGLHHENNIFRMGGLRRDLPSAFWSFLIGGSALAGLPLLTSGFFSKDLILWRAWSSPYGSTALWLAGVFGVLLTSLYTFRLLFVVFFGDRRTEVTHRPGPAMTVPLTVLGILSVIGGWVNLPEGFGHFSYFEDFLATAVPAAEHIERAGASEITSQVTAAAAFFGGLLIAWLFYMRRPQLSAAAARSGAPLHRFWQSGWAFDALYDVLFVRPVLWAARVNRRDIVDAIYAGIAGMVRLTNAAVALTQTGRVRWYAASIVGGAIFLVSLVLLS
jgi:NADH-quinone oxidoreductase subunit L